MSTTIEAIYEHGVLRPKKPVALPEGTTVRLLIITTHRHAWEEATPIEILSAIASLPIEGKGAEFSGRDHDQVLYGKKETP